MLKVIATSGKDHMKTVEQEWSTVAGKSGLPVIKVDASREFQEVDGFGAAFTDGACYMLSRLPETTLDNLLKDLFSPSAMGLSVCRLSVGQSDYGRVCYSYDDTPGDMELQHFSINYDREYIIPVIRRAREINPELFLFSSPWSPPGWMKTSGTMCGGYMDSRYLEVYARYYLKYLQEYEKAGVKINALTVQNEPGTDQEGKMPACIWHPEQEKSFVVDYFAPLLQKNGLAPKIWILDHNYNMWQWPQWILSDPKAAAVIDGVAFHGYSGTAEMMTSLHEACPKANLYWTEGGPHLNDTYACDWSYWGMVFTQALRNWCRAVTSWNLALDEKGNPNIGPFHCAGVVTVHSETREVTYSGQYWTLHHFSRYIRKGARRVGSDADLETLHNVAFKNPDGSMVTVITNREAAQTVRVECGEYVAEVEIPADSIVTLLW